MILEGQLNDVTTERNNETRNGWIGNWLFGFGGMVFGYAIGTSAK